VSREFYVTAFGFVGCISFFLQLFLPKLGTLVHFLYHLCSKRATSGDLRRLNWYNPQPFLWFCEALLSQLILPPFPAGWLLTWRGCCDSNLVISLDCQRTSTFRQQAFDECGHVSSECARANNIIVIFISIIILHLTILLVCTLLWYVVGMSYILYLHYVIQFRIFITLHNVILHCMLLHYMILYCTILCYTIVCYVMLNYFFILYHIVYRNVMLGSIALCFVVLLYCIVL
jgi:hypothetical protein